jgi:spore coat protein U-like protein
MRSFARLLLVLALASAPALATAANCRATVSSALAFGNYDPFSTTPTDTVAQIGLRCSAKATARVSLSTGSSGTFVPRQLRSATGGVLEYNVYLDAARQDVWSTGLDVFFSTERDQTVGMFARIFPRQLGAPAGAYTDSLVITVEF